MAWVVLAWVGSVYYSDKISDLAYKEGFVQAHKQVDAIADDIDDHLSVLRGVPRTLAIEESVRRQLMHFGPKAAPAKLTYEERKLHWTEDGERSGLNTFLRTFSDDVDADVIWIVNAAGDCVAASNAGKPTSFIGTNYAEREYFRQARSGHPGRQYAVGKISKIPGLFYSYPVLDDKGQFIGAVVAKRDITDFLHWTRSSNAFIADSNGVVVLTENKRLEYRTMPGSMAAGLSEQAKAARYQQKNLIPANILGKRGFIRHPREGGDPVPLSTGFPLSRERQNRINLRFPRTICSGVIWLTRL